MELSRNLSGSFSGSFRGGGGGGGGGEEGGGGALPRDGMTPFQRRRARARWRVVARIAGMQRRQQLMDQALVEKRLVETLSFCARCFEGLSTSGEAILLPARAAFALQPSPSWDVLQEIIMVWEVLSRRWTLTTISAEEFNPALNRSLVRLEFHRGGGSFISLHSLYDAACCVPHALLGLALAASPLGTGHPVARTVEALRVLKVLRLWPAWRILRRSLAGVDEVLRSLLGESHTPGLLRLMQLLFLTLYLTHTIGLLYIAVIRYESFPNSAFALPVPCPADPRNECSYFEAHGADVWRCYLRALFWAFESITGGNNFEPDSPMEVLVSSVVMAVSMSMNVALFGSIASLIAQWDERRAAFRLKLEAVEDFAERSGIAPQLAARIKRYHELVWERHNGVEDDLQVLEDLPGQLRTEVMESLYAEKIRNVEIFRHAEPAFILSLATKLRCQLVPEGEMVIRKGEVGMEMFFLAQGECEVQLDKGRVVASLSRGSYFGEIALLNAERRTASIRSKTDCELLILQKGDFEELLNLFPKTRELFFQIAQERIKVRGVEGDDALLAELPLVKRCPLFHNCEPEVARAVVFSLRPLQFKKGEKVTTEGEAALGMHFCASGRLKVIAECEGLSAGKRVVRILKEGDSFGLDALVDGQARNATSIIALESATLMWLSRVAFQSICDRFPAVRRAASRVTAVSAEPSSLFELQTQLSAQSPKRRKRLPPLLAKVHEALSPPPPWAKKTKEKTV